MKKNIVLTAIVGLLLLGAGCTMSNKTQAERIYTPEEKQTNSPTYSVEDKDIEEIKVTGEYRYFATEAPYGFSKTAVGKVCFEPAQKELVNKGNMFCFQNTDEALALLKIDTSTIDKNCKSYWGVAEIIINNLSNDKAKVLKSDLCVASENCLFNEATLVRVEDKLYTAPKCNK